MPEHRIHWTALPRAATATHLDIDVFVSPRLGVDATQSSYTLSEFPELAGWTADLAASEFAFDVSVDGAAPVPATIQPLDALDPGLWRHLFPSTTRVEPWSFRDHSTRPIRSWPVRWVLTYLRDVYHQVGNASPTKLPSVSDLGRVTGDLGGLVDTRVWEERDNTRPETAAAVPQGCLTALLAPWLYFIRLIWQLLLLWLHALFGIGPGAKTLKPHAHPVRPRTEWRYRPPAPRPPDPNDPFAMIEQDIAAHGVVPPEPMGPGAPAAQLAAYPVPKAFAQVLRFYDRPESEPQKLPDPDLGKVPPPPPEPEWDFHRRIGALGDYPRLLQRLGLVVRLRLPRPSGGAKRIQVVPRRNGASRPTIDITPPTTCTLDGDRFYAAPLGNSDLVAGMLELHGVDDRIASTEAAYDLVLADADGAAMKTAVAAANIDRRLQLIFLALWGVTPPEPESLPATQTAGIALVRADRAFHLKARLDRARQHWLAQGGIELAADDVVRGYQVWMQATKPGEPRGPWRSLCRRRGTYRRVDNAGNLVGTPLEIDDSGYLKRSGATSKDGASDLYLHEAVLRWTGWSLVAPRPGKTIAPLPQPPRVDSRTGHTVPTQEEEAAPAVSKAATGFRLETRFRAQPHTLPRLRFGWKYRLGMIWVDLAGLPLRALKDGPQAPDELHASNEIRFLRFEPVGFPLLLPRRPYSPGSSLERLVLRSDATRNAAAWAGAEAPAEWLVHDERRLFPPKTSQYMAELHGCFDDAIGQGGNAPSGFVLALREEGTFANPAITAFGTPKVIADAVYNDDDHSVLVAPYLPDPLAAGVALRNVPHLTAAGVTGDALPVHALPGTNEVVLHVPFTATWPDRESFRVRISDAASGAPHWNASTRVLTIHLDRSARVDVLYSSYLETADLDNMGGWDWLDDHDPSGTLRKQAELGAHWLISPARTLALVHAVQKPLADPELEVNSMTASRANAGDTVALLKGTVKVHLASTGRLDLQSEWEEPIDDPTQPKPVTEHHNGAVANWVPQVDSGPMPQTAHEFGDTKHRNVRYRLLATSSFREYFPQTVEFTALGPEVAVPVPASAPPDPPKPAYLVPSFGWRDPSGLGPDRVLGVGETHERTRVGGGVRVFLERGWWSSGEGERLGVVLPHPQAPQDLVSYAGIDPTIAETGSPETVELTAAMFPGALVKPDVALSERPGVVAVASFAPTYDDLRRLWVCDIGVDMTQLPWGDWPFARFALARHQPDAIREAELSKIVLSEWTQLAPDRMLTATRNAANRVTATLRGRGRVAPQANRVVFAFERAESATPDPLEWLPADGSAPHLPDVHTWMAATHATHAGGEQVWNATDLPVPDPQGKPLRLTVRELERRDGEGEVGRGVFRITYADAVRLA